MVKKAERRDRRATKAQREQPAKSSFKTAMCQTVEMAEHRTFKGANAPNAALITGGKFRKIQEEALKDNISQQEAQN